MEEKKIIKVIGGGLAGTEAAWQLAEAIRKYNFPYHVELYEMRPQVKTPAHHTDRLAELVCSNSLGSEYLTTARGVLINEMQQFDSLIISSAIKAKVPAGQALAVDRDVFGHEVTTAIEKHSHITLVREEFRESLKDYLKKDDYIVIATGPLSSESIAKEIQELLKAVCHSESLRRSAPLDRLCEESNLGNLAKIDPLDSSPPVQNDTSFLNFFDAASPILTAESIDMDIAYKGSRYDKHSKMGSEQKQLSTVSAVPGDSASSLNPSDSATPEGDYINCPFYSQDEFDNFYKELIKAERMSQKEFEKENFRYFQACMPIEAIADKGAQTLTFGPMKPKGLRDPRDPERKAVAVVQLRQDNVIGSLYNIVGFQTNLKWGEQKRVFSMIPGLKDIEIVRYGVMHQNIFINSPLFLNADMSLKRHFEPSEKSNAEFIAKVDPLDSSVSPRNDNIYFAGQITGVEGYTESAASGIIAARSIINKIKRHPEGATQPKDPMQKLDWSTGSFANTQDDILPKETMMGALANYISSCDPKRFQPINSNWGLINTEPENLEKQYRKNKKLRYEFLGNRALDLIRKSAKHELVTQ